MIYSMYLYVFLDYSFICCFLCTYQILPRVFWYIWHPFSVPHNTRTWEQSVHTWNQLLICRTPLPCYAGSPVHPSYSYCLKHTIANIHTSIKTHTHTYTKTFNCNVIYLKTELPVVIATFNIINIVCCYIDINKYTASVLLLIEYSVRNKI